MQKRPNFIIFITDQQRADMLGCAGDKLAKTPNIDLLAKTGTRFDRFYVAMPSCMPNRASILTSRYPSVNGVRFNGIPLPENSITFPKLLSDNGYRTALIGKGHLQPILDSPPMSTRDKRTAEIEALEQKTGDWWKKELNHKLSNFIKPYYGYQHVELCTNHGDACGGHYEDWLKEKLPDYKNYQGYANQLHHVYQCPQAVRTALPEEYYSTSWICERAQAFITEHANQQGDQPFLLVVSFPDPHHPFNPPGRYWDSVNPADVKLSSNFEPDVNAPPHLQHVVNERNYEQANLRGYGAIKLNQREAQEAVALTYGMIEMIDDSIGKIRKNILNSKQEKQTVQIFTSDHGDFLGDHGLMLKGPLHYQSLIRVPFIINDPAEKNQQASSQTLSNGLDIGVSILERAAIKIHNGVQGYSLLSSLTADNNHRDAILIEDEYQAAMLCFETAPKIRTLVTQQWRLTIFTNEEWGELYDLKNDPLEINNLWEDVKYADTRHELTQRLTHELINNTDTSPYPSKLA